MITAICVLTPTPIVGRIASPKIKKKIDKAVPSSLNAVRHGCINGIARDCVHAAIGELWLLRRRNADIDQRPERDRATQLAPAIIAFAVDAGH
jgi:hypothetical protein